MHWLFQLFLILFLCGNRFLFLRFYLVPCFCSCESLYSVCFVLHLFMLNAFFKCVVILGCHFRLRVRHQKADWIVCAEVGGISQGWVLYGKVIGQEPICFVGESPKVSIYWTFLWQHLVSPGKNLPSYGLGMGVEGSAFWESDGWAGWDLGLHDADFFWGSLCFVSTVALPAFSSS